MSPVSGSTQSPAHWTRWLQGGIALAIAGLGSTTVALALVLLGSLADLDGESHDASLPVLVLLVPATCIPALVGSSRSLVVKSLVVLGVGLAVALLLIIAWRSWRVALVSLAVDLPLFAQTVRQALRLVFGRPQSHDR